MKILKKILYFYERSSWYLAQAYSEAHKPLVLLNESIMIITMLKVYGYNFGWTFYAGVFIILNIIGAIIGKLLSYTGIFHYNTSFGNQFNPEIMQVLAHLESIERDIKELKQKPPASR